MLSEVPAVDAVVKPETATGACWNFLICLAAIRDMRAKAVADARRAAEDFAAALGRELGPLVVLSDPGLLGAASGVLLDPVYTGKAMFGLAQAIARGAIARGSRVLFLHTGGLLGLLAKGTIFEGSL